ncbi:MAG TPA: DUF2381 family protein, partial [Myxococcaceae bacterium]
ALPKTQVGLRVTLVTVYRAWQWAAVSMKVSNLPNQPPWAPGSARLTGPAGTLVRVLAVLMEPPVLNPGDSGLLVVETEAIADKAASGPFNLELVDKTGVRQFPIRGVKFP